MLTYIHIYIYTYIYTYISNASRLHCKISSLALRRSAITVGLAQARPNNRSNRELMSGAAKRQPLTRRAQAGHETARWRKADELRQNVSLV